MKKLIATALALVMALGLAACGSAPAEEETAEEATRTVEVAPEVEATQLGTSCLSIVLPEGYALGEDEMDEDQVAYYCAGEEDMDFDVYQWTKDTPDQTVADAAAEEVVDFDNAPVTEVDLNGVPAAYYETTEEFEDGSYTTLTYIMDADTDFVELVFWMDNEGSQDAVDAILASVERMEAEVAATQLGTSCLSIVLPEGYALGEDEMAEDQVAYYCAGEEDMDFDVYQWTKDAPDQTVADAAAEEVVDFDNAPVTEVDLNGVPAAYYEATEEFEDGTYTTLTYIMDADTDFVELVFWMDNEGSQDTVDAILASVARMDAEAAPTQLGTSCLSVVLPEGYALGEDEMVEDQVAYYCAGEEDMDFDVYQWTKDAPDQTVADAAAEEVVDFDNVPVTEVDLNGVPAAYYEATEEWDGVSYTTLTYIMDADTDFVELVFWVDGEGLNREASQADVDAILASVARMDAGEAVVLGDSNISVVLPEGYAEGEDTMDEDQIAYYCAGEGDMDFDVYEWAKEGEQTVADAAAEEVVDFDNAPVTEVDLNGVPAAFYEATENFDGEDYHTLTYIIDAGDEFIELVFWMDGEGAQENVDRVLSSVEAVAE